MKNSNLLSLIALWCISPLLAVHNLLPNGSFDEVNQDGSPKYWKFVQKENIQSHVFEGDTWIELKDGARMIGVLELNPSWGYLLISADLRTSSLAVGEGFRDNARIRLSYEDGAGESVQQSWEPYLNQNSESKKIEVVHVIPPGSRYLVVEPGLFKSSGSFEVNNVFVGHLSERQALKKLESLMKQKAVQKKKKVFQYGTFEALSENLEPLGWEFPFKNQSSLAGDKQGHWLRLENKDPTSNLLARVVVEAEKSWKKFKFSVRMKSTNLKPGIHPWETAQVQIHFKDKYGGTLAIEQPAILTQNYADWVQFEEQLTLPAETKYIEIVPTMVKTLGILEIDDVQIRPSKNGIRKGKGKVSSSQGSRNTPPGRQSSASNSSSRRNTFNEPFLYLPRVSNSPSNINVYYRYPSYRYQRLSPLLRSGRFGVVYYPYTNGPVMIKTGSVGPRK